jgi:malonate-semialdehyde dehydrogenase (acetylating) / methylmalonate-semialdehyde dehydrogenase
MVGGTSKEFTNGIVDVASNLRVGNGLEEGVQMGPVISQSSKMRIEQLIGKGLQHGGKAILDGRNAEIKNSEKGAFLKPTILTGIGQENELTTTEIFGPVLALDSAKDLDEAIEMLSRSAYGNVGVNIGVAAPLAYFPFSGWKGSFLGALHGQGRDGFEFYTDKKVVIERWPKEWSRKF